MLGSGREDVAPDDSILEVARQAGVLVALVALPQYWERLYGNYRSMENFQVSAPSTGSKPADGVATALFVKSVLRDESDPKEGGVALYGQQPPQNRRLPERAGRERTQGSQRPVRER